MDTMQSKVWLITGSSRGLGRELVEAALEHGHRVVATARKPEALEDLYTRYGDQLLTLAMDVTDSAQVQEAIQTAHTAFGRLDVVVNNAGYGLTGAFEEMSEDEFRGQIDTNFWGVVHVSRAVVPILREQGNGHLIQITSIGGRQANPGLSGYQAAKFAVEGFSESLAQELAPLGVRLTIVEPGGFQTDWAGSSMSFAQPLPAYASTVGALTKTLRSYTGNELGDPSKAALAILTLAEMPEPPLRLPLGSDAYFLLNATYQRNLAELEQWKSTVTSTDRDDLPPFDGPALLQMLGLE